MSRVCGIEGVGEVQHSLTVNCTQGNAELWRAAPYVKTIVRVECHESERKPAGRGETFPQSEVTDQAN
jgi:hypothetical protein